MDNFLKVAGLSEKAELKKFLKLGGTVFGAYYFLLGFVLVMTPDRPVATTIKSAPVLQAPPVHNESITNTQATVSRISVTSNNTKAVEGFSANSFLAKQFDKHEDTMAALDNARRDGDMEAFQRILLSRSSELSSAIDEVESGSYSAQDKEKMLNPLVQEKEWADSSYANFPR